MSRFTNKDKKR